MTAASDVLDVINRFNDAFNQHNVDGIMALMTEDCVFESTEPPDGKRHEGQDAVRAAWTEFFASSPDASFQGEEVFAAGDRAVVQWRYRWTNDDGIEDHVRGVDVLKVRDGQVAEKFSYVKG